MTAILQIKSTNRVSDDTTQRRPVAPRRASRAAGIQSATHALWPDGIPPWLSIKERDAAIVDWLSSRDARAMPCSRTIRRALNGEKP